MITGVTHADSKSAAAVWGHKPLRVFHNKNTMRNTALLVLLSGVIIALSGCQTPPPAAPERLSATCKLPQIAVLPETKEAQEKGGVEIAVVPVTYQVEKAEKTTTRQTTPSLGGMVGISLVTGGHSEGQVYVQQITEQQLSVQPDRLKFTVRVNNKLSRVFRLQGTVVQFNVNGKLQPIGRADYEEFTGGIVPPRNEAEFPISVSRLSLNSLPEKGTIGIFLYDVVTATDAAGNVTEKQNYEWYFSYVLKSEAQNIERKVTTGWIDAMTFRQLMVKEQQEQIGVVAPQVSP